jgi:glycosyltransferase involved in cell wall biosynthesis
LKVSFYTVKGDIRQDNGFGYAGHSIRNSLVNLGHDVSLFDDNADVQLNFCHPIYYPKNGNQYQIGYSPWESSSLPEGWIDGFNSVDEVWTTSQMCKEWFENAGVKKPVHVYEHGVDSIWTPKRRNPKNKIRFLHIGEPAPRKGGQVALEAFREAFGGRDDVHLTIKANGHSTVRAYASTFHRGGPRSILGTPHEVYRNVTLLEDSLPTDELVGLYHMHDVLVYPSWGEGFGLIPLQALATGMPTICTGAWAPYERFLGNLSLDSEEHSSPWPDFHPGMMYKPDFHHLVELYRYSYDNYTALSTIAFDNAEDVHSDYNWDTLTKKAFSHLEKKFK